MIPKEWLHRKLETLLLPAVVVLVGLSAFGLGRLSVTGVGGGVQPALAEFANTEVVQNQTAAPASAVAVKAPTASIGKFVASKSGTKYYLPSCAGVSRIKEENKVWFATAAEAQAAGYSAAANCPGL